MSPEQVLSHYPKVTKAVAFCETFFAASESDPRDIFDSYRQQCPERNPVHLMQFIRGFLEDEIAGNPDDLKVLLDVREEIKHPQFLTYLAAKLGAV